MDLLILLKPGTPTIHGSNQREKQEIETFSRRCQGKDKRTQLYAIV